MRVDAILFDADGVVQRPTSDRRALWRRLLGGADEAVGDFEDYRLKPVDSLPTESRVAAEAA